MKIIFYEWYYKIKIEINSQNKTMRFNLMMLKIDLNKSISVRVCKGPFIKDVINQGVCQKMILFTKLI